MQLDGKPILTRATLTAGRTLCGVSLVLILAHSYGVDLKGLKVLGVAIDRDELRRPAFWLLLFTALGYFLNWFGDVFTFRGWNKPGDKTGSGTFGFAGAPLQTEFQTAISKCDALESRLSKLQDVSGAENEAAKDRTVDEAAHAVEEFKMILMSLKKNAWQISLLGWLTLYVWHGLVPLAVTIWALVILWT